LSRFGPQGSDIHNAAEIGEKGGHSKKEKDRANDRPEPHK
jgi:hypothetical protein